MRGEGEVRSSICIFPRSLTGGMIRCRARGFQSIAEIEEGKLEAVPSDYIVNSRP